MPKTETIEPAAWRILQLFGQCEQYQSLPSAGGILDQPDKLMIFFDHIKSELKKQKSYQQSLDALMQKARMAVGVHHGG